MSRNIGPDGLPLLSWMPHESDCSCVTCRIRSEMAWSMAHFWDAESSDYERSFAIEEPND